MLIIGPEDYNSFELGNNSHVAIKDHMGGFSQDFRNLVLDRLQLQNKKSSITVYTDLIVDDTIRASYPEFIFRYNVSYSRVLDSLRNYNIHPTINYKNFLCSFNGSSHISCKLLTAILHKFGWVNPTYCSKNFSYLVTELDGHISDYVGNANNFYRKFFIGNCSEEFFQTINSFGHNRYEHAHNIYNLETKLAESFLHVVSESIATSYYPNFTEKSFYSVVTRGLFLAYAQPGWHDHLERYYGFRKYDKIFNYRFDTIQNPVERLVELMSMIAKFSVLSSSEWKDMYEIEHDTIEYNYDHYFSGRYLETPRRHA